MKTHLASLSALLVLLLASAAAAQSSYPMLMSVKPVAAQIGQSSEHVIAARYNLHGAYQVLVSGEGVVGEVIHPEQKEPKKDAKNKPPKKPNLPTMKVRFTVSPEAEPGVREFRLATPQGVSTLGQLVIVRDQIVRETGDNNAQDKAQPITVPGVVCGAIEKGEDVDFFKFKAEAGQTLSFHVRSMRLQNKIHDLQKHSDPILTLRNAMGSTLGASDNFFYGDPFLSHRFEQAGDYFIELRDVRYQGNKYWEYSLEITNRPFVSNVYPMGLTRGKPAKVQLVGFNLPSNPMIDLAAPTNVNDGPLWLQLPMGGDVTNPAPLVVSDLPAVQETAEDNDTPEKAQLFAAPAGVNGRIEKEADLDYFAFEAKKGEKYSFEIIARRQQSSLDSHLRILDAKGKQLSLNDDFTTGKITSSDSQIENWTAPANGKYLIEVRDIHLRGGEQFIYFIQTTKSRPYFELYLDTDKTPLSPGTAGVVFVRVKRKNGFTGEVTLSIDGLPEGVTASCGKILAGKGQDACIVLEAAKEAALSVANVYVAGAGSYVDEKGELQILSALAVPQQETYLPGGGRGHWPVGTHTVSVGAPSDIRSITLSETNLTLKPGESKKVAVTIERAPGFDKNITLDMIYRHLSGVHGNSLPQGVTIDSKNSKTLLTSKETKGHITLKAADNAPPVENQQVSLMANVSINFVMKATYTGKPLMVSVVKP